MKKPKSKKNKTGMRKIKKVWVIKNEASMSLKGRIKGPGMPE